MASDSDSKITVTNPTAGVIAWAVARTCHAGAGHAVAQERGAFGPLCDACWDAVRRVLKLDR